MIAFKFLSSGRVGPFTGFRWEEGEWVEADPAPRVCDSGVHACRVADLPFWVNDELWAIELDGEIVESERKVVAARGRLVRRAEAWDAGAAHWLADSCAARARALADVRPDDEMLAMIAGDCERRASQGRAYAATFIAAFAAERGGGRDGRAAERAAQAAWFADLLR